MYVCAIYYAYSHSKYPTSPYLLIGTFPVQIQCFYTENTKPTFARSKVHETRSLLWRLFFSKGRAEKFPKEIASRPLPA